MRLILSLLFLMGAFSVHAQSSDPFADGKKAKEEKKYEAALELFKKATVKNPSDGEAWYELGWSYNELEKFKESLAALKNAKAFLGDKAKVYFESGYASDNLENVDDAIADYKKAIELDENYTDAYQRLADVYYLSTGQFEEALKLYDDYIAKVEEEDVSSRTWCRKGYCENDLGKYEAAIASLKKAISLNEKYVLANDELGFAYYKLERTDEAIAAYQKSRSIDSTSATACTGLGDIYRYLKNEPDMALSYYKKGVALDPKSQASNYGVGWALNEKEEYTAAIPYLKKAIELNSKFAASYTELGYAYYGLKKYDDALIQLQNSLRQAESSVAYYYCGLCYISKKNKIKAQEMHKKLVELNYVDAPKLLTRIEAM